MKKISCIGVGSGWGAPDQRTANGPEVVLAKVKAQYPEVFLSYTMYHSTEPLPSTAVKPLIDIDTRRYHITRVLRDLAFQVYTVKSDRYFPIIIGGDHSLAMGTWAGISQWLDDDFSLLWFDAHMDAHTSETSLSKSPHGMPVASLIGEGHSEWVNLNQKDHPSLKAENLYQFGIRSFEGGEKDLLTSRKANIYSASTCKERSLVACINEALLNRKTTYYGISIDVDAFDPSFAPGTGTTEPNGLNPNDIISFLQSTANDPNCLALEIMEFNPDKDKEGQTLQWICRFIEAAIEGK